MDSRRVCVLMLSVVCLVQACSGSEANLSITTDIIESVKTITEDDIRTVTFNYTLTDAVVRNEYYFGVCAFVKDVDIAMIHYQDSRLVYLEDQPSGQFNFSVKGLFVGRTYIHVKLVFFKQDRLSPCQEQIKQNNLLNLDHHFNLTSEIWLGHQTAVSFEGQVETVVIRQHRAIDTAFNVGIVVLVVIINLGVGCKTDLGVVKETLRRPVAPVTGLSSQFIIMPLISFACVKMFRFEPALALGFFALGCSPGGSASNAYTMLLDGDVSLSITMTFISTFAALGMVPLWLLTLGRTLYRETSIRIPYQNIFYSLIGLLVPVCMGLVIKHRRPRWAKVLVKVSKVVMVVFLVYVLTVGVYTNLYIFRLITLPVVGASAILPYLGFALGSLVAWVCRMPGARVLTVAIETGIQNTGIAIVLLLLSLPHPESDISIVAPIVSAIFTPVPLWVAIAVVQGRKRCCRKDKGRDPGDDKEAKEALRGDEGGKTGQDEENGVGLKTGDAGVGPENGDSCVGSTPV